MAVPRRSLISREGWPWLFALVICGFFVASTWGLLWLSPVVVLGILAVLLFHDPGRNIPPLPLAVVAPIDGRITEIVRGAGAYLPGEWQRITIKTNHFGAYSIRAPIEGAVLDVRGEATRADMPEAPSGLWLRSEEQDEVVLLFPGRGYGLSPKAFVRYGERVGQGQRFAYLRLAPYANVYLRPTAQISVNEGERVHAGTTVLAQLAPQ